MHSGARRTATRKARAHTKRPQEMQLHSCLAPAQPDEHKHGSCLEKKLLRKERDEDCTKATVVRTSIILPLSRGTLTDSSVQALRGQGQRLSGAVLHGSD